MGIKTKLAMGIATGALAVSLIGGGTYAFFNDVETNKSSFAAGTLDINVTGKDAANAIIDVKNIKPQDKMYRTFNLNNIGSLDVSQVLLTSKYTVIDAKGDNKGADLGDHIKVDFLKNNDKGSEVIKSMTLKELNDPKNKIDVLAWTRGSKESGLGAGTNDTFLVKFEFVDNKQDQNIFQGDSLKLEWTFDAKQTNGTDK